MKKMVTVLLGSVPMLTQLSALAATPVGSIVRYDGCGDVAAAVAISDDVFVVASRNDNVLRAYTRTGSAGPQVSFDLSDYLEVTQGRASAIQGATRVGDQVYWLASHGRDEDGTTRPERHRFFATTIVNKGGQITIQPVGKPVKTLVHKLVDRHTMRTLRLDKATQFGLELTEKERKNLAPSRNGIDIAALCASHNAEILMAFRNPRPLRVITGTPHALIVPLDNPAEMIREGEDPIFGEGILLDLEGMGIVGFEYSEFHEAYFLVAAWPGDERSFALYRWSGMKANQPKVVERFNAQDLDFFPETIVSFQHSDGLLLLGNGFTRSRTGRQASYEPDTSAPAIQSFRGYWVRP